MAGSLLSELFVSIKADTSALKTAIGGVKTLVGGLGASITAALGPVAAAFAAAFTIKQMVSSFMEGELAVTELAAALETNGFAVDENIDKFSALAKEIQAATRIGDEQTFGLIAKGLNLGLPAGEMDTFAKSAIGLGTALKMGPEEAMAALAKEAQGVKSTLDRQIPALKGVTDQAERLAIISELAQKGLDQEGAATQTLSGMLSQLWNALGDVAESLGSLFAPLLKVAVEGLQQFAAVLQTAADYMVENGGFIQDLADVLSSFLDTVFFVGSNFDLVISSLGNVLADFGMAVSDRFNYVIEVITSFGSWLAENWSNIWTTALGNSIAILSNWGNNLKSIVQEAWDWIKSGGKDAFEPVINSWNEGTKQISKPFKMPEFKDSFDREAADAELQKEWDKRRAEWDAITKDKPLEIKGDIPIIAEPKDEKKKKQSKQSDVGTFSGLGEAFKRANSQALKAEERRREEAIKTAKKQLEEQERTNKILEEKLAVGLA